MNKNIQAKLTEHEPVDLTEAQEESRDDKHRRIRVGCYIAGFLGLTTAAAITSGISPGDILSHLPSLDSQAHLDVPVFDQITRGMVAVNDGLRTSSLYVSGGAIAATGGVYVAARNSRRVSRMRSLASTDYVGSRDVTASSAADTVTSRRKYKGVRRVLAGTALATTVFVTATAGIEHEVSRGPERAISQTLSLLSPESDNPRILAQNKGAMFMNNSYINRDPIDEFVAAAAEQGVSAMPFNRELVDIRGSDNKSKTALVLGVPETSFIELGGKIGEDTDCSSMMVIADKSVGAKRGNMITINDVPAEVSGTTSGLSSMNRVGIIASESQVAECLQKDPDAPYYGVVVTGDEDKIEQLTKQANIEDEGVMLSKDQLIKNNRHFWQANGTPILLQMTGYILGFGLIANRNERRATFERDKKELGMMRALGVSIKDLRAVESLRALRESASAAIVSGPIAVGLATVVNAAEHGLRVGISAREVAVGFTVTLAAKLFGTHRAIGRFAKQTTPYEAMKGN